MSTLYIVVIEKYIEGRRKSLPSWNCYSSADMVFYFPGGVAGFGGI